MDHIQFRCLQCGSERIKIDRQNEPITHPDNIVSCSVCNHFWTFAEFNAGNHAVLRNLLEKGGKPDS